MPGLPPAGGLAGGGGRDPAGRLRRPGVLGPARARLRSGRRPDRASWASRRRPTAATGPGGSSPATGPATCCSPRCTGPAWPTSRRASPATTGCACATPGSSPPCGARRRTNKPTPDERDTCAPWLHRELALLPRAAGGGGARRVRLGRVIGRRSRRSTVSRHRLRGPGSATAARVDVPGAPALLGCYHVSQQNTFTGRLTPAMLDAVLARPRRAASLGATGQWSRGSA